MLGSLKRLAAPTVLGGIRSFVKTWNYELVQKPSAFWNSPESELTIDFDFVLAHYMQQQPAIEFLQVGAFDGVRQDPLSEYIRRFRWKGVLVEPQPDVFARLVENYSDQPQLTLIEAAIAAEDGVKPFYRIRRDDPDIPEWTQMVASFDRELVLKHEGLIPNVKELIEEIPVRCCTIQTLLSEASLSRLDLLQIDAEGFDFEIIKMIDFDAVKPAIINYEHVHLYQDDYEASLNFLTKRGYLVNGRKGRDTVAYLSSCVSPSD